VDTGRIGDWTGLYSKAPYAQFAFVDRAVRRSTPASTSRQRRSRLDAAARPGAAV